MSPEIVHESFWQGRRVFLTGHTGFKGAWLALWLERLGAEVTGFALPPPSEPSLFTRAELAGSLARSIEGDLRSPDEVTAAVRSCEPEVVFHLGAQAIVRHSYEEPVETFATNVLGTAHVLDAVRHCGSVRSVVVVTSDKCYENLEREEPYTESAALGGRDPYSASKAAAEIVARSFRDSFFSGEKGHPASVATARAGNVIGGGDWADDRLVPDTIRALESGRTVELRYPEAVRPWQHVLDPLAGYLALAERLANDGDRFAGPWNFASEIDDARPVGWLVERIHRAWGVPFEWREQSGPRPHEASLLILDASKAREQLGWRPRLRIDDAIEWLVDWYRRAGAGEDARTLCLGQIAAYQSRPPSEGTST